MKNLLQKLLKRKPINQNSFIKQIPLLNTLTESELLRVHDIMHERTYESGEFFFHINQPGAAIFFIKDGHVRIFIPANEHRKKSENDIEIAELGEGDFFGELALLDNSRRSASVMATSQTSVMAIFRGDFEDLLVKDPVISSKINRQLALMIGLRLKKANY